MHQQDQRNRRRASVVLGAFLAVTVVSVAQAHDDPIADDLQHQRGLTHGGGSDGHVSPTVNYGFTLVGETDLGEIRDGLYTDVWAHKGHAYVGTFQNPDCTRNGVFVANIEDPEKPYPVTHIKSPPDTRINDVKAHAVGDKDYLFVTLEKCGDFVGKNGRQKGQGGVSVYDITKPAKPHAVKQNLLDFQTHNTFPWTDDNGSYLMVVDDENVNDVHIVDISKPQSPKLIATTGIQAWLDEGTNIADDGQLFTGGFAFSGLHDIWVEEINGAMIAILSYWDAGFIKLDVSDPANPVYLEDSTYPAVDPVNGGQPEGNAHAAVFGGNDNRQLIFAGDEDFDPFEIGVLTAGGDFYPATTGSNTPLAVVEGPTRYMGRGCDGDATFVAADPSEIAVISRGVCAFTTKVANATEAGYAAAVVMNDAERCEASVNMAADGTIPAFFVPRPAGLAILGETDDCVIEPTLGTPGQTVSVGPVNFNGWGYFHVLNNTDNDVTVPVGMDGGLSGPIEPLGHMGYYAPSELTDPAKAIGFGDLTMHNVETDPNEGNRAFISWYAAGMRAVEWRPGHLHNNAMGEGITSWNVHEVGRFIDERGSNIWGVTVYEHENGETYILGSDRNLGLQIFSWECVGRQGENPGDAGYNNYCDPDL